MFIVRVVAPLLALDPPVAIVNAYNVVLAWNVKLPLTAVVIGVFRIIF